MTQPLGLPPPPGNVPPPLLPFGWYQVQDPNTGRPYYVDSNTNTTHWEPPKPPSTLTLPPPPRPVPETKGEPSSVVQDAQAAEKAKEDARNLSLERDPLSSRAHVAAIPSQPAFLGFNPAASADTRSTFPIPVARSMIDFYASNPEEAIEKDLELCSLSVGQLADLCYLHRQARLEAQGGADDATDDEYVPIDLHAMPVTAKREPIEQARLDTRLQALEAKLQLLKYPS